MTKNVSLEELQIAVSSFDSSASLGSLVFTGFSYLDEYDFYKVFMMDLKSGQRYVVGFLDGRFVGVVNLS